MQFILSVVWLLSAVSSIFSLGWSFKKETGYAHNPNHRRLTGLFTGLVDLPKLRSTTRNRTVPDDHCRPSGGTCNRLVAESGWPYSNRSSPEVDSTKEVPSYRV